MASTSSTNVPVLSVAQPGQNQATGGPPARLSRRATDAVITLNLETSHDASRLRARGSLDLPWSFGGPVSSRSSMVATAQDDSSTSSLLAALTHQPPQLEAQSSFELLETTRRAQIQSIAPPSQPVASLNQSATPAILVPEPRRPLPPPPLSLAPENRDDQTNGNQQPTRDLKQWQSWKTDWLWLSFLLIITVSIILVISTLDWASRYKSGFSSIGKPPSFLTRRPALEKALWNQGILYTALPAFIMTLYTMLFSSSVTHFVQLQPFMDLAIRDGAPAKATILLDYRTYPIFFSFGIAFRNKHCLLAIYMLLSLLLTITVVPLTSFLFTDASFTFNGTLPISFTTTFNETSVLLMPDFKLPMDFAAAFKIYGGSPPPWTDGQYAFPRATAQSAIHKQPLEGNMTFETTAYSAYLDCRAIPEDQYDFILINPIGTPIPSPFFQINSTDRGCFVQNTFYMQVKKPTPYDIDNDNRIVRSWATATCGFGAGISRLTIASGLYNQDSRTLTNFSLVSCIPSYWTTPGTLTVSMSGLSSAPLISSFSEHQDQAEAVRPQTLSMYFERELQELRSLNPTTNIDANEYGRQILILASKLHPKSPLLPESISEAAQILFTSIYSVFVSTTILQPAPGISNGLAIHSTQKTRLVVVSPVAYIIITILSCIVLAISTMFSYGQKPHILLEEPAGLLSYVNVLHGSNFKDKLREIGHDGVTVSRLKKEKVLHQAVCKRKTNSLGSTLQLDFPRTEATP